MEIAPVDPADDASLSAYVAVRDAVIAADSPWVHPESVRAVALRLRHGWDGEPEAACVATVAGEPVGTGAVVTSEWDNHHLAWLRLETYPAHRRRGLGSRMLDAFIDDARSRGRTTICIDGWDTPAARGFAARHALELASVTINRRQSIPDIDWPRLEEQRAAALERAAAYELLCWVGPTPEDRLEAVARMAEAINDAPTDDLDVEDEVFPPERLRGYEAAQTARGHGLFRVVARHRDTGEYAGHTVVAVDGEHPERGYQHDTTVVGAHRGHRLGLLLKAEMNLWLRDAQPQLTEVDTWNAESNDHMIGVNELLGYRVMGRQLEFQKRLAHR